ncbi:NAD-dependent epimerase/dehydratase family protein [Cellulosimicrobium funkei]|nr:NAD-dependent epimerase/dehydratase family protein [Cellulosimicrobium funkei]
MTEQPNETIPLTGARGFLGWHTRAALRASGHCSSPIAVGEYFDIARATATIEGTSRLIHMAGVNRASEEEVRDGNLLFAEQVSAALHAATSPPPVVVFANSTQEGNGTSYGSAKQHASDVLASTAEKLGIEFIDVKLPNLFGEHGKPFYNAVTSTFCHMLAQGGEPEVTDDKELTLLHAQNAADLLTGLAPLSSQSDLETRISASNLLASLKNIAKTYSTGEIPDLSHSFTRDLFNTYRSYNFNKNPEIRLDKHTDTRGSFFEMTRTQGGESQSSFSTTAPGVTRGEHFHRRKVERFTVLVGTATIAVRRLFSNDIQEFQVAGDSPVAIDMPTLWTHKITNTSEDTLFTSFWSNELYDEGYPDTVKELV